MSKLFSGILRILWYLIDVGGFFRVLRFALFLLFFSLEMNEILFLKFLECRVGGRYRNKGDYEGCLV